jgi:hypothetical protein
MRVGGSNDNYHHISANERNKTFSRAIAFSCRTHESFRAEMFDICFAMFDVKMRP